MLSLFKKTENTSAIPSMSAVTMVCYLYNVDSIGRADLVLYEDRFQLPALSEILEQINSKHHASRSLLVTDYEFQHNDIMAWKRFPH